MGGQISFFGPAGPSDFALTGTLRPGPDGPVWEDRGDDSQELMDILIGDGQITFDLLWTDESGCSETIDVTLTVPGEVTAWWELLPPFAPADCTFTGTLVVTDGVATFTGTLTDDAGEPVEGQPLTLEIFGHEPGRDTITTTTGPGGSVEVTFDAPPGDVSSTSVSVVKGATSLGSTFASSG